MDKPKKYSYKTTLNFPSVKFFPDIDRWEIKWKEEGKYGIRVLHSSSMEGGIEEKEESCGQGGFREHAWRSMGCMIIFFFQNVNKLSWTF